MAFQDTQVISPDGEVSLASKSVAARLKGEGWTIVGEEPAKKAPAKKAESKSKTEAKAEDKPEEKAPAKKAEDE